MTPLLTPTQPLLIGLTGRAGAGKDTAGAYLEDQYACCAIALADPIRDMLCALLHHIDVDEAWLTERALKERPIPALGVSYRHLAQTLGTTWGRGCVSMSLWVRIAMHRVQQIHAMGSNAVITDIRFPNEAAWLHDMGGTLVRIERPDRSSEVRPHISEAHTDTLPAEHTLCNHGSVADLHQMIDTLMADLRGPLP